MQWGSREEGRRKVGQCHGWACPTGRRSTISKVVPQIHCKDDKDILGTNSSCELIIRSFLESLLCMFSISTACSRSLGVYKHPFQEGRIKDVGSIEGVASITSSIHTFVRHHLPQPLDFDSWNDVNLKWRYMRNNTVTSLRVDRSVRSLIEAE